jgi:predicted DNA-binding transcriptional regulator AlpA
MRLLRKRELLEKVPLSYKRIWELEREGRFPARRQVGPHSVAWREDEVDRWVESLPLAKPSDSQRYPRRTRAPKPAAEAEASKPYKSRKRASEKERLSVHEHPVEAATLNKAE